jgi:membrane dipeptidase
MTNKILCLAASTLLLAACGSEGEDRSATVTVDHAAQAQRIAHESIIIDTHIDAPYRLASRPADVSQPTDSGDFDYPRAVAGGLNVPFMSIYTPAEHEAEGGSGKIRDSNERC